MKTHNWTHGCWSKTELMFCDCSLYKELSCIESAKLYSFKDVLLGKLEQQVLMRSPGGNINMQTEQIVLIYMIPDTDDSKIEGQLYNMKRPQCVTKQASKPAGARLVWHKFRLRCIQPNTH